MKEKRDTGGSGKNVPLMIVGTMSDSGKSVVAAAFCRYFSRRGEKVVPFKAQNMALNSFVTREGGEMGRAQVVQAAAAGVEPHTDMNPVLLKPMGEAGSQVVLNGKAIGTYPAPDYYSMKAKVRDAAHEAYDRLSVDSQRVVLEGAGSPAEINLMEEDFVNMSMAEYAGADVILVADIDRGGVYASIYGTLQLLPEKHRKLVKGIIINKFRGDLSLLESGNRKIEELTGVPVLGVLPYLRDLRIEDEDSLALEHKEADPSALLDVVVIRLPHISNFTDVSVLERTPGVSVRYLSHPDAVGHPDLLIIPGTKNTMSDLRYIEENGWASALSDLVHEDVPVIGICGGYQMLGARLSDPAGIEGEPGEEMGLNLLPLNTVFEERKELAQVEATINAGVPFAPEGTVLKGYEIHSGRTSSPVSHAVPLTVKKRRRENVDEPAGAMSDDGMVFGCYIHGLFDAEDFRRQLLDWLCSRKGIDCGDAFSGNSASDDYDRLADTLEEHIDLKQWSGV